MKCGACKWYKARQRKAKSAIQQLKSGTCHINPPGANGWPECHGEDMACREFEPKEPKDEV